MDDESRKYFLDVKKEKYFYTMTRPVTSTSKHTKIEKHPLSFICYPFLLLSFPLFAELFLGYQIYIVNNNLMHCYFYVIKKGKYGLTSFHGIINLRRGAKVIW